MTRAVNFCPRCGAALIPMQAGGKLRPFCRACQQPVYIDPKVAVVVFIEREGMVLLIQRAVDPGKGKWALPAGFVDFDEAPASAARREALEETGIEARINTLLAVFPKRDQGLADITIAYSAEAVGGSLQAGDDAADAAWFSREALPPLVPFPSNALVERWRRGKLDFGLPLRDRQT